MTFGIDGADVEAAKPLIQQLTKRWPQRVVLGIAADNVQAAVNARQTNHCAALRRPRAASTNAIEPNAATKPCAGLEGLVIKKHACGDAD